MKFPRDLNAGTFAEMMLDFSRFSRRFLLAIER